MHRHVTEPYKRIAKNIENEAFPGAKTFRYHEKIAIGKVSEMPTKKEYKQLRME